jgi:UDP-N-acetylmuramyl pentapeptide synthase
MNELGVLVQDRLEAKGWALADLLERVDIDAEEALALLRAELREGDVVLVKASNSAGLSALAEELAQERSDRGIGTA